MISGYEVLKKFTVRNTLALATCGVFLHLTYTSVTNPTELINIAENNTGWAVSGAILVGTLVAKVSDIYQFFFRKPQNKETT